jgi:CheY-like chemotaxis protein
LLGNAPLWYTSTRSKNSFLENVPQSSEHCSTSIAGEGAERKKETRMSRRILVIDDNESLLEVFQLILESEGYDVFLSTGNDEEVQHVEALDPSLIILDAKLGQDDGFVLVEKLKRYPPTKHIPLILCTAAVEEIREQEDTLRQRDISVLYKPFELDELLQVVEECLRIKT